MATPAASAYHRRRHVLATPSNRISTVQRAASLPRGAPEHLSAPVSVSRAGPPPSANASGYLRRDKPKARRARRAQPSLLIALWQLRNSLFAKAEHSVLKAVLVTLLCAFLGRGFIWLSHLLAFVFPPCMRTSGSFRSWYRFSSFVLLLRGVSYILCTVLLFTMHFLFARVIMKQMRCWRRAHCSRSVLEGDLLRLRLLHAAGCMSGAVLQTIFIAYALYGPTLVPVPMLYSQCATPSRDFIVPNLIPNWTAFTPHISTALLGGAVFSIVWSIAGAHGKQIAAFPMSTLHRLLLHAPRAVLLAAFPALICALPAASLTYAIPVELRYASPEVGVWPVFVERLATVLAASSSLFLTLFSWTAIAVLEDQLGTVERSPSEKFGKLDLSKKVPENVTFQRDRFVSAVQEFDLVRTDAGEAEDKIRELLCSLSALVRTDAGIAQFPAFLDSTGEIWRVTLQQSLSPIECLQDLLREYSDGYESAMSAGVANGSLFIGPSRGLLPDISTRFFGSYNHFSFPDSDLCILSAQMLAKLFEASYELDTFGVVHRTLPPTIRALLLCKEQTEAFIAARNIDGQGRHVKGPTWKDNSLVLMLKDILQFRSDCDTVSAIDDALSLCIYRIIATFRSHMQSFVDGLEVSWDRSMDAQLQAFLDYQKP